MTKISFIGDVMLGRVIGQRYGKQKYDIVDPALRDKIIEGADIVFANLESPVVYKSKTEGDHLQFKGNPDALDELKWIDIFTLSNNHITDCGTEGITETIEILERKGFKHNGIYSRDYEPFLFNKNGEKVAIVVATDMLNIPFAENCAWKTMRVGDEKVMEVLKKYHDGGYCVILYAHIGMLFTRYPNPFTCDYLHKCVENGADIIVTAHSHCLGGMEMYKDKPIFHSLGDFIMDGNSFRRRRSAALKLNIEGGRMKSWSIVPAMIDMNYMTVSPELKTDVKMRKSFEKVTKDLKIHASNYQKFFKTQYKKEMLNHTISTLYFLMKQRGISGMLKMVSMRFEEVLRMFTWVSKDRSKDRRDDDAIRADRKKFKDEDLYKQ